MSTDVNHAHRTGTNRLATQTPPAADRHAPSRTHRAPVEGDPGRSDFPTSSPGLTTSALPGPCGGERARMKPYYEDDKVTLYHGDCLEVLRTLHDESIDIVVTSPPYNMGLVPGGNGRGMYRPGASNKAGRFRDGYGKHDDAMEQGEYDRWQREVLAECWRISRMAVFYNHRPRVEHGILRDPLGNDFGIPLRQRIIWNRGTGIDVNLRTFCTRGEYIFFFAKPDMKLTSHSASGMGDVWDLGIEYGIKDHPAPFPLSLPARCIEATGATSVLDPYSGSGTTLRAAADAGIRGIGIELEERHCAAAVERLAQGALTFGEIA